MKIVRVAMKMKVMHHWVIIGVILLLIGVAVAPSINFNVVKASDDNDLVEVQTQKLTRQQRHNLQNGNDTETHRYPNLLTFAVMIFQLGLIRMVWLEEHTWIQIRDKMYLIHPLFWLREKLVGGSMACWVIFWLNLSDKFSWNWDAQDFLNIQWAKNI